MLTAINDKGQRVIGWEANKENSYYCPSCEEKLIIRQGEIKIHHFAHVAETKCKYGIGETEEHLLMKKSLYQKFLHCNLYKNVQLEHRLGEHIADIYLQNRQGKRIVVECQVSDIDILEFKKRTASYSYQEIYTLWIFSGNTELDKRLIKLIHTKGSRLNYTSSEVERKCHRWYYGRIYYFYNDNIYAIHLHQVNKWVPSSCDECLQEVNCPYPKRETCPRYKTGYFRKSHTLREISIYPITDLRLVCIDRKDRLRVAKFNEPNWWNI